MKDNIFKLFVTTQDRARAQREISSVKSLLGEFLDENAFELVIIDINTVPYAAVAEDIHTTPVLRKLAPYPPAEIVSEITYEALQEEFGLVNQAIARKQLENLRDEPTEGKMKFFHMKTRKTWAMIKQLHGLVLLKNVFNDKETVIIKNSEFSQDYSRTT